MSRIITIANQKGGVGKTVTTLCLGVVLAENGKKVLLVDFDPQGDLTKGLGFRDDDSYMYSLKEALFNEIQEENISHDDYVIHTKENVDLIPANTSLSGVDIQLASVMSRETVFKRFINKFRSKYDYILIDSNPALNLFMINALTAADSVIIPVQAEPYVTDGLNDLVRTILNAKKQLNPKLSIDGILITMTDARTNLSKHISSEVRLNFGNHIKVFKEEIPRSVKTAEASLSGQSPILYSPNTDTTQAYRQFAKEVLKGHVKTTTKNQHKFTR